jgi:mono/diheme cytochrome c family protein
VDVVTNGKGSMPASADKLSKKEIEEVAQYVMDQSEKGW